MLFHRFKNRVVATLTVLVLLSPLVNAQQPGSKATTQPPDSQAKISQTTSGFITPGDVNVSIGSDIRMFVVMAALNIAGFDYEPGSQPLTTARTEIRKDLATRVDPQLKAKLSEFYKANRRPGVEEGVDATRYAALSLMMTPPPSFSVYTLDSSQIPEDVKPLLAFIPLVQEFYVKTNIKDFAQKYLSHAEHYAIQYRRPVGEMIYQIIEYFHLRPETVLAMKPVVISTGEPGAKVKQQKEIARTRSRQVFVILDPLACLGSSFARDDMLNAKDDLLARRIGDDYIVALGPSRDFTLDAVRTALIRFIIDPLIERSLRTSLEYKDPILHLAKTVPTSGKAFQVSVYQVVRESLAKASEIRMKRIASGPKGNYTEDEAIYDLAQNYLRGAVLSFHFYESLIGLEKVGIGLEDFFSQMMATIKFDREAKRASEFEPVVARVVASRKLDAAREKSSTSDVSLAPITRNILNSDDLIRQKRYAEARTILEEILTTEPNNARALYGMARVINQMPSPLETDPKSDENDKIQSQHERLQRAIKFYQRAIEAASPETEKWLIQWSYVSIGRIYDFQEFRQDAISFYEKAIAIGDNIPNGAFKEALEGKQKPFGSKQN